MLRAHGLLRVFSTSISLIIWLLSVSSPVPVWAATTQASLTSGSNGADRTRYTTASITPGANKLIIASIQNSRGTSPASTPTLSGNGLTWVRIATVTYKSQGGADRGRVTMFRALGASPSTGSVTIDFGGVAQKGCTWSLVEFDGVDTSGTNGSGAVVQSATTSGLNVSSLTVTLAAFGSVNNGAAAAFAIKDDVRDLVPEPGWTEMHEVNYTTGDNEMMTQWRADNDTTATASWGTGEHAAGIAIEIKAPAPADTTPPTISTVSASGITQTTATTAWTTNESSTSQVEYGTTTSYGQMSLLDTTLVTSHSVLLSGLSAGTLYHYRVRSKDAAGNETVSADATFTTVAAADTTPPTGSITINGGATATNNSSVTLTLSATDDSGTVAQMQLSNDGVTFSVPEPYATSKTWSLSAGDGTKTVSVKFADGAGNWSVAATDTIALDTPPIITITSPADGAVITAP